MDGIDLAKNSFNARGQGGAGIRIPDPDLVGRFSREAVKKKLDPLLKVSFY
jgi:hypothetical protein